jgi:hypothetical protein
MFLNVMTNPPATPTLPLDPSPANGGGDESVALVSLPSVNGGRVGDRGAGLSVIRREHSRNKNESRKCNLLRYAVNYLLIS